MTEVAEPGNLRRAMNRIKNDSSRQRALGHSRVSPHAVKSAARALQILEFLDDLRRAASLMEVSTALGYPASSASELMHTMTELGWLECDAAARTYRPSVRVRLLGHWVRPEVFRDGALLRMLQALHARTGESAVLATRNGGFSQYIHVVQRPEPHRLHLTLGTMLPLAGSGTGYTLLSTYTDEEVWRILSPWYADREQYERAPPTAPKIRIAELPALYPVLAEIRAAGHSYSEGTANPDGATVAMPLPVGDPAQRLVVALVGLAGEMRPRRQALIDTLRDEVSRYLGPAGAVHPRLPASAVSLA